MIDFETQYQAEFEPTKEKYPLKSEVFANGKVYKVVDYVITGKKSGVVAVDREGNEKELYEFEAVQYKICGRCGGSGRYAYNQTDGSRCYGCSGIGKQALAPTGFPQKIKAVCTLDLPKFAYKQGDETAAEFCGFSRTGGTPKYATTNGRTKEGSILMHCTIEKHFEIK